MAKTKLNCEITKLVDRTGKRSPLPPSSTPRPDRRGPSFRRLILTVPV
jgi:hypothetical protein